MNNCTYFVEGKCEEKLLEALKLRPSKMKPGKVKVYNVLQNSLQKSILMTIRPKTTVALVFDTDIDETDILKENIRSLKKYCRNIKIVYLPQVRNFEDELERCCNLKSITDLTCSKSRKDFKKDFCRMKEQDCRNALERHNFNHRLMWSKKVPEQFSFLTVNYEQIKII